MIGCSTITEARRLASLTTGLSCSMGTVSYHVRVYLNYVLVDAYYYEGNYQSNDLTVRLFCQLNGINCLDHLQKCLMHSQRFELHNK